MHTKIYINRKGLKYCGRQGHPPSIQHPYCTDRYCQKIVIISKSISVTMMRKIHKYVFSCCKFYWKKKKQHSIHTSTLTFFLLFWIPNLSFIITLMVFFGFPWILTVTNLPAIWETWVQNLSWEESLERAWQPTPVSLPGQSHEQRSLVGYSPWCCNELDTPEQLSTWWALDTQKKKN